MRAVVKGVHSPILNEGCVKGSKYIVQFYMRAVLKGVHSSILHEACGEGST